MKILALNGSHRGKRGFNFFLLSKICEGAQKAGADCEIINLVNKKINYCHACDICKTPKSYLKCVYAEKDDVYGIFDKMRQADVHIFSTPIYVFNVSSLIKRFFERLYGISDVNKLVMTRSKKIFHYIDSSVVKPFLSILTCDSLEDRVPKSATLFFKTYSEFLDAPHLGNIVRNGGLISGYGKDKEKFKTFPHLEKIFNSFGEIGFYLAENKSVPKKLIKTASREIIPLPFFKLIKNFKPFKKTILARANEMLNKSYTKNR